MVGVRVGLVWFFWEWGKVDAVDVVCLGEDVVKIYLFFDLVIVAYKNLGFLSVFDRKFLPF